jgi:hypothetical protein
LKLFLSHVVLPSICQVQAKWYTWVCA